MNIEQLVDPLDQMDSARIAQHLEETGEEVVMMARDIFQKCGAPDDFAIQGPTVFGSVNRIKLTAFGWKAMPNHCNPEFLAAFKKIQGEAK